MFPIYIFSTYKKETKLRVFGWVVNFYSYVLFYYKQWLGVLFTQFFYFCFSTKTEKYFHINSSNNFEKTLSICFWPKKYRRFLLCVFNLRSSLSRTYQLNSRKIHLISRMEVVFILVLRFLSNVLCWRHISVRPQSRGGGFTFMSDVERSAVGRPTECRIMLLSAVILSTNHRPVTDRSRAHSLDLQENKKKTNAIFTDESSWYILNGER